MTPRISQIGDFSEFLQNVAARDRVYTLRNINCRRQYCCQGSFMECLNKKGAAYNSSEHLEMSSQRTMSLKIWEILGFRYNDFRYINPL